MLVRQLEPAAEHIFNGQELQVGEIGFMSLHDTGIAYAIAELLEHEQASARIPCQRGRHLLRETMRASSAITPPSSANSDDPAEAFSHTGPTAVGARSRLTTPNYAAARFGRSPAGQAGRADHAARSRWPGTSSAPPTAAAGADLPHPSRQQGPAPPRLDPTGPRRRLR